jgi:hypothetical protein
MIGKPACKAAKSPKLATKETRPRTDHYKVGPGRPPREHQWKPGQSGNPKGRKGKPQPIEPEIKNLLEQALNRKVTLRQGGRERSLPMIAAGMEQLATRVAQGDLRAIQFAMELGERVGLNLLTGSEKALTEALGSNAKALLDAYVARQSGPKLQSAASPVLAPPELLDDDEEAG